MNTHGHESIAEDVGKEVLEKAFGSRIASKSRFSAFYLGNWIADVCQIVDPILENSVYTKSVDAVASINAVVADVFIAVMNFVREVRRKAEKVHIIPIEQLVDAESTLAKKATETSAMFAAFLKEFREPRLQDDGKRYSWNYMLVQPAFLLKGYLKFVHPEPGSQTPRMDLKTYLYIFEALYQQYFPHEHFDRPWERDSTKRDPTAKYVPYDTLLADGPRAPHVKITPDLYEYLRDFLAIVAGRLTDLDINWAKKYLEQASIPDTDREWDKRLAELGYAVHGMEDFFAHSNFIEHAAKVMGNSQIPWFFQVIDNRRFLKRLTKYKYNTTLTEDEWELMDPEKNIVTGSFDTQDTMFSLLHLGESALEGFADIDITRHLRYFIDWNLNADKADEEAVKVIDETVSDFLKFIHDPSALKKDNAVAKAVEYVLEATGLDNVGKLIEELRRSQVKPEIVTELRKNLPLLKQIEVLQRAGGPYDPEDGEKVIQAFFDYLRAMTLAVRGLSAGWTMYKLYREIMTFYANPPLWILKHVESTLSNILLNYGLFLAKEQIWMALGMERIGSHSLLSKDHGQEWLYKPMKHCASAVHYYILNTITRWSSPSYRNTPEQQKYVDWLALVEYFTLHPAANLAPFVATKAIGFNKTVVPAPAQLQQGLDQLYEQLVSQFRLQTLNPDQLTKDNIFRANVSPAVRKKEFYAAAETAALATLGFGHVVVLRRIIIPAVEAQITVCNPADLPQNKRWYFDVVESGWKVVQNTPNWPETANPLLFRTNLATATERIGQGNAALENWKSFYRPENDPRRLKHG